MAKLHRFFSKEERTLKEERGLKTPEGGEGRTCISFHLPLSPLPRLRALTQGVGQSLGIMCGPAKQAGRDLT